LSLPEIGGFFGSKHHTTILYAWKKIKQNLKKDNKLKLTVNTLTQEIKNL
jgi:chromosomal replication initiator protein